MPTGAVEALGAEFADLVQFGSITRDWYTAYAGLFAKEGQPFGAMVGKTPPAKPKPPAPAELYRGAYANKYFGDAVITSKAGKLQLTLGGPRGKNFPLRHWDADTFVFDLQGEDAAPGSVSTLIFKRERGKAKSVQIEYFGEDLARGVFKRR